MAHQVQDFSSVGTGPSPNWKALGDGSSTAKHFIHLFNTDPADWPNDGKLLPVPAEVEAEELGVTPRTDA